MAANQTTALNENNTKQENSAPVSSNKSGKKKGPGLLSYLFPILLALSIIFGTWAYVIKSNKFGLGEMMRPGLKNIPVLSGLLPPSVDPEAPENMSLDKLAAKYNEYRAQVKDLNSKIDSLNKTITDLQKYKDNATKVDQDKAANIKEAKNIAAERKQLQADKLKFAEDVKNKDKQGFAEYFEKISPDIAQKIYQEVMKENQVDAQVANYVKTFEGMEPANAAKILENMGYSNMDLVANIIKLMKKQAVSQIISNMDPVFAANLEDRIAVEYPIYPSE